MHHLFHAGTPYPARPYMFDRVTVRMQELEPRRGYLMGAAVGVAHVVTIPDRMYSEFPTGPNLLELADYVAKTYGDPGKRYAVTFLGAERAGYYNAKEQNQ